MIDPLFREHDHCISNFYSLTSLIPKVFLDVNFVLSKHSIGSFFRNVFCGLFIDFKIVFLPKKGRCDNKRTQILKLVNSAHTKGKPRGKRSIEKRKKRTGSDLYRRMTAQILYKYLTLQQFLLNQMHLRANMWIWRIYGHFTYFPVSYGICRYLSDFVRCFWRLSVLLLHTMYVLVNVNMAHPNVGKFTFNIHSVYAAFVMWGCGVNALTNF